MKIGFCRIICFGILVCFLSLMIIGCILHDDDPYRCTNDIEPRSPEIRWSSFFGGDYTYHSEITYEEFMDSMFVPLLRGSSKLICNIAPFITPNNPHIEDIARYLTDMSSGSVYYKAMLALNFVQCAVMYETDPEIYGVREHWALPIETLYLGKGDCEDVAFLYCSILLAMGIDAIITDEDLHIGVGVNLGIENADPPYVSVEHNGHTYFMVNATADLPTRLFTHAPLREPYTIREPDECNTFTLVGSSMLTLVRNSAGKYMDLADSFHW